MDDPVSEPEGGILKWTKEDVRQWLKTHVKVHPTVAQRFFEEDVLGEYLRVFDKSDILDVTKKHGPAVKITAHLELLKQSDTLQSPFPDYVAGWSVEQVYQWVTQHGKIEHTHAKRLLDEEVSGDCLVCFKKQDFLDLKMTRGPAVKILALLRELKNNPEPVLNAVVTYQKDSLKSPNTTTLTSGTASSQPPSSKKKHQKFPKASNEANPTQRNTKATRNEATRTQTSTSPTQSPVPPSPVRLDPVRCLILDTLDQLGKDNLKKFKFYLKGFSIAGKPFTRSELEVEDTTALADVLLNHIGPREVLSTMRMALEKIPRRDLIADLEKKMGGLKQQCAPKDVLKREADQGEKLRTLLTCGTNSLDYYTSYIVVVNKSDRQQLEYLQFLNKLKLFCVLDFDPDSAADNGLCHSYEKSRVANKHTPALFQGETQQVIDKLNLYKQTSWVFCNGRHDLESESYRELDYKTWFRKACRDMEHLVSFICKPDVLLHTRTLIIFLLLSPVSSEKDPIFDTYNAFYKNTEGENIISICEFESTYKKWRLMIEGKCDCDISNQAIWELSLSEINGTVMALGPFDQPCGRLLPSSDSSTVILTRKHEDLMTALDVCCLNQCEDIYDSHVKANPNFKVEVEEEFYRGGKVKWWNFYLCEKADAKPFIKRDKYEKLKRMIKSLNSADVCTLLNLFHHPGCGGTTLAMHVMWDLRSHFRCAVLKDNTLPQQEVANQVRQLMTLNDEKPFPVLLLVEDSKDTVNARKLSTCIKIAIEESCSSRAVNDKPSCQVVILNCVRSQSPQDLYRKDPNQSSLFITTSLTPKEQDHFEEKLVELRETHTKPENFYSFMIMKSNFDPKYVAGLARNTLENFDFHTKNAQLFAFLSLLNTYVFASEISLSISEEFLETRVYFTKEHNVLERMKPYANLLIIDQVEEWGRYKCLRILHHSIASACLEELERSFLKVSEIIMSILHCDLFFTTTTRIGKGNLLRSILRMLIERQSRKDGDERDRFSPLIEKIHKQQGRDMIQDIFAKASSRFDKSASIPQALARYLYLNEQDFIEALIWAEKASQIKENSYTVDTIGQVHKSKLKSNIPNKRCGGPCSPEDLNINIEVSKKAISAFKRAQELSNTEDDPNEDPNEGPCDEDNEEFSTKSSYNINGNFGVLEVAFLVFEMLSKLPFFEASDPLRKKYLQSFLKGSLPITSVQREEVGNRYVDVLKDHQIFLVSLRTEVKSIFDFFDDFFTFTKENSSGQYYTKNRKTISEHFKKYVVLFCASPEERQRERDCNPNLNQKMLVEEQRTVLEEMHADTFAGILQHLDKGADVVEEVVKCYAYIQEHKQFSDKRLKTRDQINYIWASIILSLLKPNSKYVEGYAKLHSLLLESLQEVTLNHPFPDPYFLAVLFFWPVSAQEADIRTYVRAIQKSSHKHLAVLFRKRSTVAHFYLGKGNGLARLVPKHTLDECFTKIPRNELAQLWLNGGIFRRSEITSRLQRVTGLIEIGEVYAVYGTLKIPVRPAYIGNTRSGLSTEKVSFYIGFAINGPLAYDIQFEN